MYTDYGIPKISKVSMTLQEVITKVDLEYAINGVMTTVTQEFSMYNPEALSEVAELALADDEFITGISGEYDEGCIYYLTFVTNKGNSVSVGASEEDFYSFSYDLPQDEENLSIMIGLASPETNFMTKVAIQYVNLLAFSQDQIDDFFNAMHEPTEIDFDPNGVEWQPHVHSESHGWSDQDLTPFDSMSPAQGSYSAYQIPKISKIIAVDEPQLFGFSVEYSINGMSFKNELVLGSEAADIKTTKNVYEFDDDEYIVDVWGTSDTYINSLVLLTSNGREIQIGSDESGEPFSFSGLSACTGCAVVGFTGQVSGSLDILDVHYVELSAFRGDQVNTFMGVSEKSWQEEMKVSKKLGGLKGPEEFD